MFKININGKFITDNPQQFLSQLKTVMSTTKTVFSGLTDVQQITDVIYTTCEKSEQTDLVKEKDSNKMGDEFQKEEVIPQ